MLNKVFLIGNLGADPEMRHTGQGTPVTSFRMATSNTWRDRDGNKKEATEWHNVVAFNRQAEVAAQYLHRGKQVHVEGRLQTRSWEDKETHKTMYRTEIIVERFIMLGGARRDEGQTQRQGGGYGGRGYDPEPEDDDIPF